MAAAIAVLGLLAACGKSGGSTSDEGGGGDPPPDSGAPSDFSYPSPALPVTVGVAIEPQTPAVTGSGIDFSAAPTLPTGLTIDSETGELSGTPTEISPIALFTITASNSLGSAETVISFTVHGFPRFAYTANRGDNTLSLFTVEAASGELRHHGYVAQQAFEALPSEVQVDPLGRFLYSVNSFALTPYIIDSTTGKLTVGAATPIGTGPHSLFIHPSGEYLFLASDGADQLRSYAIDPTAGTLELIEKVTTGDGPTSIAGDPGGRFLHLLHGVGELIQSWIIDTSTGEMELGSSLDVIGIEMASGLIDPVGENLYALVTVPFGGVVRYHIDDPATGELVPKTATTTGTSPVAISISPDGDHLYMLNAGTAEIALYTIADDTGDLTDETMIASTAGTVSMSFSANGLHAWAVDEETNRTRVLAVDPETGSLTEGGVDRGRPGPQNVSLAYGEFPANRRNSNLYVVNSDSDDVTVYAIDAATGQVDDGGALAATTGTTPLDIAFDPLGRFAFTVDSESDSITVFAVGSDGSLTDNLTLFSAPNSEPTSVAVDPSGRYVYTTMKAWENLLQLTIDETGTLSTPITREIGTNPEAVTIDPSGLFLYVVDRGDGATTFGSVSIFSLDPTDGTPTEVTPAGEVSDAPTTLAFAPGGARAYVTASDAGTALPFDVAEDGTLSFIAPATSAGTEPNDIVISPDGAFAFVAELESGGSGSVLVYDVDPSTGTLFDSITGAPTWRTQATAGVNPRDVEISLDGEFLYVLSGTTEEVDVFSFDRETAILTSVQVSLPGSGPVRMRMRETVE
jgi:6-phosphogluconolactonase (cycloisomerase 2 family)